MPSAKLLRRPAALGIIGYPLDRTASPAIHNTAFRIRGIPWTYAAFRVAPDDLQSALEGFAASGVIGFNVTYPYKESIAKYLNQVTQRAQEIGAVNTVWQSRSGWVGDNTDLHGFAAGLRPLKRRLSGESAIIFGAGGAARTAAFALIRDFNISALLIVARRPKRAHDFVQWASHLDPLVAVDSASLGSLDTWRPAWKAARLIVNATPVGMSGAKESLLPAAVRFQPDQIAYDLIYGRATRFLTRARRAGAQFIPGDTMLWQQAARSFEIWTGKTFPLKRALAEVKL